MSCSSSFLTSLGILESFWRRPLYTLCDGILKLVLGYISSLVFWMRSMAWLQGDSINVFPCSFRVTGKANCSHQVWSCFGYGDGSMYDCLSVMLSLFCVSGLYGVLPSYHLCRSCVPLHAHVQVYLVLSPFTIAL
jgi:hypothetical protein